MEKNLKGDALKKLREGATLDGSYLQKRVEDGTIEDLTIVPNPLKDRPTHKNIAALTVEGNIDLWNRTSGKMVKQGIGKRSDWEALKSGKAEWSSTAGKIVERSIGEQSIVSSSTEKVGSTTQLMQPYSPFSPTQTGAFSQQVSRASHTNPFASYPLESSFCNNVF